MMKRIIRIILYGQTQIGIFTESKRNGVTYHAHPNYNSFGEWYDWAMVAFECEDEDSSSEEESDYGYYGKSLYPVNIICFLHALDATTTK